MGAKITRDWLQAWARQYPRGYDTVLEPLRDRPRFDLEDLEVILRWKLRKLWPKRAIEHLHKNNARYVQDATSRAFADADDLASLAILLTLRSVGPPVASAILMAQNPERFTVADRLAWKSLINHDYLREYEKSSWEETWVPYLGVCRELSQEQGVDLRDVDSALWAAKGRTDLP